MGLNGARDISLLTGIITNSVPLYSLSTYVNFKYDFSDQWPEFSGCVSISCAMKKLIGVNGFFIRHVMSGKVVDNC